MYGIFTYIGLIVMVNIGTYTIHGWYGWSKYLEPNLPILDYSIKHAYTVYTH